MNRKADGFVDDCDGYQRRNKEDANAEEIFPGCRFNAAEVDEHESLEGSRGGERPSGLRLHSLRLPGLVAHQEVMFGAPGETYTLRHDTIDRSAYMPGVLLTVRKVGTLQQLVYGLERLI